VKKPPKPAHPAQDDSQRQAGEQRRQATLDRLEDALKQQTEKPRKGPQHNGDPYNTAGPAPGSWHNGRKR
jgi:hypothetical protein